ncbi:MAG: DUF4965 domain-containing protein [Paludibacter sp.]|nr:DUF4965 domain-containing protein [Paludibacter sp.]
MNRKLLTLFLSAFIVLSYATEKNINVTKNALRAPAYPLITIDPYTSGWSFSDKLYDSSVKHWTGKDLPLLGVIKVDNKVYRFMGVEEPELSPVVCTSEQGDWTGKFTTTKPDNSWINMDYDDSKWAEGKGAFGTTINEPTAKTNWETEHIWVRRVVAINENLKGKNIYLEYSNDDWAIISINGVEVLNTGNACHKNAKIKIPANIVAQLKAGKNIMTAYCRNPVGNGLLDFGLLVEKEKSTAFDRVALQKSVEVQATQTHYVFACGNVDLKLTFTAPLFMDNLNLLSRPVNYISYAVNSTDGKSHKVQLYFEASPRWSLDQAHQESVSESFELNHLVYLKTGSKTQNILGKKGDDVRIDWGYFYLAAEKENTNYSVGNSKKLRADFVKNILTAHAAKGVNENANLALVKTLGIVKQASGKIMVGYDDLYSIQYFGKNLRPYWNTSNDQTIISQFQKANTEYKALIEKCNAFDRKLMADATLSGGKKYAQLCALAYRQAITAHKLVKAPNGDLLFLSKENFSNGSIGTVDVTYPSAPLFLYYNPELAKGLLNAIFYFSESNKWVKPFPSHDVGTYPLANGQTYGGDMPIEESGNMLIVTAAIAVIEGNATYAAKHWDVLTIWAKYLIENGLDPENQLCTDDFAGHFAHNTNLSVKAILGVAAYGHLADMLGKKDIAQQYTNKAREMAQQWTKMADDGDHYRLVFDKQGTWSQKYNLVWDKILHLNIFPKEVIEKEIAYYLTKQNKYGLPLDNRETYTKTDWIMWTATLSKDKATFEKLIDPVYLFTNETEDRVPLSDWIFTDKPTMRGFQARSVVGGFYIKMLEDKLNKQD